MFIETLLSKALDASLGMLADYGLKKASELRGKLLGAAEPRQRAFEAAWQKAAEKIEEPRLRSLLEHRPFQEQVAAALLDKLNLLDIKAAIKGWSGVLTRPEARLLEDFMRHLGELLLADDAWGDILGRYHTLRFQEETLQALRQRQLPEDDRQLVQYVSQAIQGDVITGGEKHDIRVGD
ncbi:MAG: hypothetical protein MUC85_05785, partial [Anaerolineales bacterium]|nr:hypothetical protein [Anaerolineales bacterium]